MSSTSSQFSVNVYTFPYRKKTFKTFELLLIYIVKMHPLSHDDAHTNTNTNTHTHTHTHTYKHATADNLVFLMD